MNDFLTALDVEVKYLTWLRISAAASRLAAHNDYDTRKVFMQIWVILNPEYARRERSLWPYLWITQLSGRRRSTRALKRALPAVPSR